MYTASSSGHSVNYALKYTNSNSHNHEFCLPFKSSLILPSLIARGVCILNHLSIDSPQGLIICTQTPHTHCRNKRKTES